MTRAWRWLATLRPLLVLHAALLRRWKGCLLSFLSGTTPGATPLFETSPSLQIKPLAHGFHTLVTPRLAAFGRVFEIPDAELWRRGWERDKTSQAMSAARQPPKWTGRERRTPSPRACYRIEALPACVFYAVETDLEFFSNAYGSVQELKQLHPRQPSTSGPECLRPLPVRVSARLEASVVRDQSPPSSNSPVGTACVMSTPHDIGGHLYQALALHSSGLAITPYLSRPLAETIRAAG
ncbi:predicted protein [Chaetomium globosum CBS 148.51]|uniref:Uncharacterized protein n=1 Tax=Chaetomium globosum (strain ATCC 6205 / CBS 148.51 / DSM 1962 / NBRC 6347 / NRRL 1970) TaxID=306901 RepID=Q2H9Z5_CHAGB|nr:uncharacterized protein CHGG_02959 [Chaetomium globosum CBS 148.51]EAQ91024.1 predicted protein [Chaetomium globosum CBS 148.51]